MGEYGFESLEALKAVYPACTCGLLVSVSNENGETDYRYFRNDDRVAMTNMLIGFVFVNDWTAMVRSFNMPER